MHYRTQVKHISKACKLFNVCESTKHFKNFHKRNLFSHKYVMVPMPFINNNIIELKFVKLKITPKLMVFHIYIYSPIHPLRIQFTKMFSIKNFTDYYDNALCTCTEPGLYK